MVNFILGGFLINSVKGYFLQNLSQNFKNAKTLLSIGNLSRIWVMRMAPEGTFMYPITQTQTRVLCPPLFAAM